MAIGTERRGGDLVTLYKNHHCQVNWKGGKNGEYLQISGMKNYYVIPGTYEASNYFFNWKIKVKQNRDDEFLTLKWLQNYSYLLILLFEKYECYQGSRIVHGYIWDGKLYNVAKWYIPKRGALHTAPVQVLYLGIKNRQGDIRWAVHHAFRRKF